METDSSIESSEEKTEKVNFMKKVFIWFLDATKRTFRGHEKSTWAWIIIFMIISIVSIIILIIQYLDETWLFGIVVRWFVRPILELEEIGWIIFIIFMGIQGILVPIPSELVLLSSGLVWGLYLGSIIGIIGSMAAGILTYYIAVLGGRPMMEHFLGEENLEVINAYIEKYGAGAIFIARAFPFMAFDPISYASGFLKIKLRTYIIATFIGSIIRCIFYAWLGSTMSQGELGIILNDPSALQAFIDAGSGQFNTMLIVIVVVLGVAYLLYQFLLLPYLKRKHFETKAANASLLKKNV